MRCEKRDEREWDRMRGERECRFSRREEMVTVIVLELVVGGGRYAAGFEGCAFSRKWWRSWREVERERWNVM